MSGGGGGRRNRKLVQGASQALDMMKYEIAQEFGVQLGADQTSRMNGSVGGEITKRMVQFAEEQLSGNIGEGLAGQAGTGFAGQAGTSFAGQAGLRQ